jgi:hypothetical protein
VRAPNLFYRNPSSNEPYRFCEKAIQLLKYEFLARNFRIEIDQHSRCGHFAAHRELFRDRELLSHHRQARGEQVAKVISTRLHQACTKPRSDSVPPVWPLVAWVAPLC